MNLSVITNSSLNEVWQNNLEKIDRENLMIFGYNGFGLVSYKKELEGKTEYFHDLARFSKQQSSVIVCACDTDTGGVYRHSAVLVDNGRILGVSDSVYTTNGSEFVADGYFRVYNTSKGKIGILLGEDLFFPDALKVLTSCDVELVVCFMKKIKDIMPQIVLRSYAYINGITMLLVANNYYSVVDNKGKIIFAGNEDINNFSINIDRENRFVWRNTRFLNNDNK